MRIVTDYPPGQGVSSGRAEGQRRGGRGKNSGTRAT